MDVEIRPAKSLKIVGTAQDYFPSIFPLFPHLVESPANTIGFSTCKDYDPYQPSITPTHGHPTHPTGGGARGNHDHHRGRGVPRTVPYIDSKVHHLVELFRLTLATLPQPGLLLQLNWVQVPVPGQNFRTIPISAP